MTCYGAGIVQRTTATSRHSSSAAQDRSLARIRHICLEHQRGLGQRKRQETRVLSQAINRAMRNQLQQAINRKQLLTVNILFSCLIVL